MIDCNYMFQIFAIFIDFFKNNFKICCIKEINLNKFFLKYNLCIMQYYKESVFSYLYSYSNILKIKKNYIVN